MIRRLAAVLTVTAMLVLLPAASALAHHVPRGCPVADTFVTDEGPVAVEVPDYCEVRHYQVRRGDNLWNIARRMYGGTPQAGLHWRDIARANRLPSSRIYPGQTLIIPVGDR